MQSKKSEIANKRTDRGSPRIRSNLKIKTFESVRLAEPEVCSTPREKTLGLLGQKIADKLGVSSEKNQKEENDKSPI